MKRYFPPVFLAILCVGCLLPASAQVKPADVENMKTAMPEHPVAKPKQERKLLVFSKTNGFRHGSIPFGIKAVQLMGEQTGAFSVTATEDESYFEPETLKQFDAVLMLNTTGEVFRPKKWPDDPAQKQEAQQREERLKQSLVNFVKNGGGLAGFHSATDTYKRWDEYNKMMGGAFAGHPWHMEVPVRLLDEDHPLNKIFDGQGFTVRDEIYQFRDDTAQPTDRRMLLSLDPTWDQLKRGKRKDNFYPISWVASYGKGRTFYCSLGHRNEIYWNPKVLAHYLAGLQYALGDLDVADSPIEVSAASE